MGLGELIGQGRTADIFLWGETKVIKLFHERFPKELVEQEAERHSLVQTSKLRIPKSEELVEVNGRYGLIYERIEGRTLNADLEDNPWKVVKIARLLAKLHVSMHQKKSSGLPSIKKRLEKLVRQTEVISQRKKWLVIQTLKELTDGQNLCHGDFHPDNVLMSEEGPVIIDWVTATQGNPIADVARTSVIIKTTDLHEDKPLFVRWLLLGGRWMFLSIYLREYIKLAQIEVSKDEIKAWEIPVAVARLHEGISEEEQEKLLKLIDKLLSERYSMRLND